MSGLHDNFEGVDDFQLTAVPAEAATEPRFEGEGAAQGGPEEQYCVFRSGRERFCLPVLEVEEVVEWPPLTRVPLAPPYLMGIFNLRGAIVPLVDIALTEGRRPGLLPKHVVVASLRGDGHHEIVRVGIAADEVVGTYTVTAESLLEQAPENVPYCTGMLRHDDRLALLIDLKRLLEVYPGPAI